MFIADQYRAKAAEYSELAKTAKGPREVIEFHDLERSFTELANDEQWVTDHQDQIFHAAAGEVGEAILVAPEKCPFDDREWRLSV